MHHVTYWRTNCCNMNNNNNSDVMWWKMWNLIVFYWYLIIISWVSDWLAEYNRNKHFMREQVKNKKVKKRLNCICGLNDDFNGRNWHTPGTRRCPATMRIENQLVITGDTAAISRKHVHDIEIFSSYQLTRGIVHSHSSSPCTSRLRVPRQHRSSILHASSTTYAMVSRYSIGISIFASEYITT